MHKAQYEENPKQLQREASFGPIKVPRDVRHYSHSQGRLPYPHAIPRVYTALPVSCEGQVASLSNRVCQVSSTKIIRISLPE